MGNPNMVDMTSASAAFITKHSLDGTAYEAQKLQRTSHNASATSKKIYSAISDFARMEGV